MIVTLLILQLCHWNEINVFAQDTYNKAILHLKQANTINFWDFEIGIVWYRAFQEYLFNKAIQNITLKYNYQTHGNDRFITEISPVSGNTSQECFTCFINEKRAEVQCMRKSADSTCSSEPADCSSGTGIHWADCSEYLNSTNLIETRTCGCLVIYTLNLNPIKTTTSATNITHTLLTSTETLSTIDRYQSISESTCIITTVAASIGTCFVMLIIFVVIWKKWSRKVQKSSKASDVIGTDASHRTINRCTSYEISMHSNQTLSRVNEVPSLSNGLTDSVIYTEIARSNNGHSNSVNIFNADKDYISARDVELKNYILVTGNFGLPRSISQFAENVSDSGAEFNESLISNVCENNTSSAETEIRIGEKSAEIEGNFSSRESNRSKCIARTEVRKGKESREVNKNILYSTIAKKNSTKYIREILANSNNDNTIDNIAQDLSLQRVVVSVDQSNTSSTLQHVQEGSDDVKRYTLLDTRNVEAHQYLPFAYKPQGFIDSNIEVSRRKETYLDSNIQYVALLDVHDNSKTVSDRLSSLGLVDGMLKLCQ